MVDVRSRGGTPARRTVAALAQALAVRGSPERAIPTFQRLVRLHPNEPGYWHGLGMSYWLARDYAKAELWLERAARVGGNTAWHTNYGNQLELTGRDEAAIEQYEKALALHPGDYPALMGLSKALYKVGRLQESRDVAIMAMRAEPGSDDACCHASQALVQSGRVVDGLALIRRGLEAHPNSAVLRSMYAGTLVYDSSASPTDVRTAAEAAWREYPRVEMPRLNNGRCAIVSADLRHHSVGYFARALVGAGRPWLAVYNTSDRADDMTAWFRERCDLWRDVAGLTDDELRAQIIADRIDVLVELGGYSYGNRLAALARRCAPVQVTYLGWPATTGVPNIDVRVVDAVTDPPGSEAHCSERVVRVSAPFVRYEAVDMPPVRRCREPVFGSFNAAAKLDERTLALWGRVVREYDGARLVLKVRGGDNMEVQGLLRAATGLGFAVQVLPHTKDRRAHLEAYNGIAVALDPLGYNGTTTTCEAMSMGVPVVTMIGDRHASRVGASLGAFTARDENEYVRVAHEAMRHGWDALPMRGSDGFASEFWASVT